MANLLKTVEALSAFSLQNLGEEWVKLCWDSDFEEIPALEPLAESGIVENEHHVQNLHHLSSVMDDWIDKKEGLEGEGFWMVLVENDFSHKDLIVLLAYLVEAGSKRGSNVQQRGAAVLSSSSYFKLLTIPGSAAFKVFHPVLFEKCVDILKQWNLNVPGKRKKSVSPACSQKRKKNRGNRTQRSRDSTGSIEEFPESSDEEDISPQEMSKLTKLYLSVLQDLIDMLMVTSLRHSESSAYHTVQVLCTLTRQGAEIFDESFQNFTNSDRRYLKRLPAAGLAYKGLQLLSLPLHGHVNTIINAICKSLLPNLLMVIGDNRVAAQTIPKPVLTTRDQALNFIKYLMKSEARCLASVRTLLQHLCTKVTDRAEYRTKCAQTVVSVLQEMPSEPYGKMVEWFFRLSKHAKMSNRAFALEIVSLLLNSPERELDGNLPPEVASYVRHTSLLGILLDRCSDAAPTVRARAIAAFSQCFTTADTGIRNTLKEIVTPVAGPRPAHAQHLIPTPEVENRVLPLTEMSESEIVTDKTAENAQPQENNEETPINMAPRVPPKTPFHQVALTPFNPNLPDEQGVLSMLRRRARDEKVNVRKAALQALECVIKFEAPDYRRQDLDVLVERCRDPALSVRKQALQSLTDLLLAMPTEKPLQKCWLDGVLPLVIDRESTLQEKCMETLEEIVLNNVAPVNRSKDEGHQLVWNLLEIMTQFESCDLRRYLQKACRHWARVGKIKSNLTKSLESHVGTRNNQAAWMLLAELAPAVQKISHSFLVEYWEKHAGSTDETEVYTLQRVLTVMGCCARHVPADRRDQLIDTLKDRLKKFDSPPELISTTINTLSKLCEAKAEALGLISEREIWCTELLTSCDKYLSKVILQQDGGAVNEDLAIRHLFTLGEIAQLCPARTPKRVFLIVQSMVAAPCITTTQTVLSSQAPSDNCNSGSSHDNSNGDHSGDSNHNTEAQTSGSSQQTQFTQFTQLTQFRGSRMSNRIRAFAFIALGKLCLQNADLAKKCVAALARELEISDDPTIRNNIVIILCDLCVRYTTTVELYMPSIAACLKDSAPLVRKQTLILITRLLQEDFLKWKGALFFRFITTVLDEKREIAEFSEYCLIHVLLQRKPAMFSNHFMECIFHFNAYEGHSAYNKFTQNEREKKIFSLRGSAKERDRLKLYTFMLEHMTDEQRFQMTAKICTEILGGVVDNVIPLDNTSSSLLKDALAILSCKEIKLSSLKTKPQEDAGGDEQEMAAIVIATAKKTLISQVVKKNVIENIVPIVVSLKHMLEKHRSPVLKDLMYYLRELMQDYKSEVKDILSADRQLAKEIEFDLRKFEEEQEEIRRCQDQQNTVQNLQETPGSSPRPVVAGPESRSPQITPLSRPPEAARSPSSSPRVQRPTRPSTPAPVQQLNKTSPIPASPALRDIARDQSLSTLAILNSARKAFLKAKDSSTSGPGLGSRRKSCLVTTEKSSEQEETPPLTVRFSEDLPSETTDSASTPPRATRATNRAISTPTGANFESVLDNITFHIDQNVTLIPPSPIPSSIPIRVYPADSTSAPPTCVKGKDNRNKDFIYMFSPDKPLPKPRKWNVTSPAPVSKKNILQHQEEDVASSSNSKPSTEPAKSNSKPSTEPAKSNSKPSTEPAKLNSKPLTKPATVGKISNKTASKENSNSAGVVRRRSTRRAKHK
ncbi:condensin-2 complex subunit D3-like isoform X2 [Ostrea edulis]|uniref:condensin-2 complex subunit D3-like isoform X2 n=1 Tax=Ostrea edulis TaxID=37623 RepID=UPI0024AF2A35|nr:condensin-2 complex subunit D3-like isoform X2 [Ostrea edulis]